MSESNQNPTDLVEVSDELAALINGEPEPVETAPSPTAITPAPETAPAPTETAPAAPAPTDTVPEWFNDVPPEQRPAAVQRLIDTLPPEQRNSLPAIQQTARNATQQTAAQVQQQTQAQNQQQQRDAALETAATQFAEDIRANLHPDSRLDVDTGTNTLILAAQNQYHDQMAANIEQGLLGTIGLLGVQQLPDATIAAINGAQTYGDVIRAYGDFFANRGFELGRLAERNAATETSATDKAVLTARYKQWGIAQAAKDGRMRLGKDEDGFYAELINDIPVPLGSGAVSGGGDDLSQEEFEEAIADPDYYDRLMENPAKKSAWQRAVAGAMSPA